MWEILYSKNGLATKNIALELLAIENGQKIPTVSDFCERLNLGRGTVQGSIKLLEMLGAIELEARGHLGTFLLNKDVSVLLDISGTGPLVGVMPLPYSKKYEGLATGIVDGFERLNKRISLAYMRGASNRLEALKSRRYDFAIVSRLAAEEGIKLHKGLEIVKSFGLGSYVSKHKVFLANPAKKRIESGMRIGIDRSSPDQATVTLLECQGLDVEFVDVNYMQLFQMLKENQIDAAVWNIDEIRSVETFNAVDFQSEEAKRLTLDTSEATIVVDSSRTEVIKQITLLDAEIVLKAQRMVESGERFPQY
ncbi:GntR family transcriptional regulator YhfZ [Bacillus sp. V33-4]|uniref:GntR family transcriptional regulator YhfZ n=1 Tax=Bacillus sp. V33-4 TaxID=2054169 RepID=UPI000C75E2C8|nr:GntR family transcriptional regulator YhfZ [Bacillus sp. V33-4]PLR80610.1 transcriptional regulator [Bacillus sp. V33-4]